MNFFIILFISLLFSFQNKNDMKEKSIDLIYPQKNIGLNNWNIVNDDVMGGISKSYLSINDNRNLIFNGYLSLENNGGFASSRLELPKEILKDIRYFKIKLRGDGNIYKLRFRQDNRRASYSSDFKSIVDKWVEVDINIEDFKPSWRGYSYNNYPPLDLNKINSLGIQISDKQEGPFRLEIKYIKAFY